MAQSEFEATARAKPDPTESAVTVMGNQAAYSQFRNAHARAVSLKNSAVLNKLNAADQLQNAANGQASVVNMLKDTVGAIFPELSLTMHATQFLQALTQYDPSQGATFKAALDASQTNVQAKSATLAQASSDVSYLKSHVNAIADAYNQFRSTDADIPLPNLPSSVANQPMESVQKLAHTLAIVYNIEYIDRDVQRAIFENMNFVISGNTLTNADGSGGSSQDSGSFVRSANGALRIASAQAASQAPTPTSAVMSLPASDGVSSDAQAVDLSQSAASSAVPAVVSSGSGTLAVASSMPPADPNADLKLVGILAVLAAMAYAVLGR